MTRVFNYNEEGIYTGQGTTMANPRNPSKELIPRNSTTVVPPEYDETTSYIIFDKKANQWNIENKVFYYLYNQNKEYIGYSVNDEPSLIKYTFKCPESYLNLIDTENYVYLYDELKDYWRKEPMKKVYSIDPLTGQLIGQIDSYGSTLNVTDVEPPQLSPDQLIDRVPVWDYVENKWIVVRRVDYSKLRIDISKGLIDYINVYSIYNLGNCFFINNLLLEMSKYNELKDLLNELIISSKEITDRKHYEIAKACLNNINTIVNNYVN